MVKVYTLRNIITLFIVLFFGSCSSHDNFQNSRTISEVKSISSEDRFSTDFNAEINKSENGQVVYVVKNK